ncbi:phage gp45-like [Agrobacterium vitis]|nr:phage gp45-like [Agrobacterium vitis]MBE1440546.1 phage gp45-like [Agrobacterium vitis]
MKEIYGKLRGMVRRVTVKNIKDDGQMQTASAEVADGIYRDELEIMLPYGVLSVPDDDGAVGIALAIGGDEGDMVLLPLGNPSQRMGGLNKGDVGLANKFGDRVICRANGKIEVQASNELESKVGGCIFRQTAAGVDIVGGYLKVNGVRVDDTHTHGGIVRGGSQTDPPAS